MRLGQRLGRPNRQPLSIEHRAAAPRELAGQVAHRVIGWTEAAQGRQEARPDLFGCAAVPRPTNLVSTDDSTSGCPIRHFHGASMPAEIPCGMAPRKVLRTSYGGGTCAIACGKPAGMAESAPVGADRMDSRTCGAPDSPVPTSRGCSDQRWGVLVVRSDGSVVRAECGARRRLVARGAGRRRDARPAVPRRSAPRRR